MQRIKLFVIVSVLIFSACNKDEKELNEKQKEENITINSFIWNSMQQYYLWTDLVPALDDSYYENTDEKEGFFEAFDDHSIFFESLIFNRAMIDKWSWIVDDYQELENALKGNTTSYGFEFKLLRYSGNDLIAVVLYVHKGSPADIAGMKRGYLFRSVNNQNLNVSNYIDLLFSGNQLTFSILSDRGGELYETGIDITIAAAEIQENPIFIDSVYEVNGSKVGYFMYNGFYPDYDKALNSLFSKFKSENVDNLIIDLRYNSGGSVLSLLNLASMIHTTDTNKVILKMQYNDEVQSYLEEYYGTEATIDKFQKYLYDNDGNIIEEINTLNLNKVYVITTDMTASASESLINGLKPYMEVVTIGTQTSGKYTSSITIKDVDMYGNLNTSHNWALQPIVAKVKNVNNETDFVDGLAPTYPIEEDLSNMLELGSRYELLLETALDATTGYYSFATKSDRGRVLEKKFIDSKSITPSRNVLLLNEIYPSLH
ncbi:MAG: hypothetical protein IPO21_04115 [Bacteroidales bacterium]|nr:hypothetical protein [Bacteroidales bacterium]